MMYILELSDKDFKGTIIKKSKKNQAHFKWMGIQAVSAKKIEIKNQKKF